MDHLWALSLTTITVPSPTIWTLDECKPIVLVFSSYPFKGEKSASLFDLAASPANRYISLPSIWSRKAP